MQLRFVRCGECLVSAVVATVLLTVPLPVLAAGAPADSVAATGLDIAAVSARLGRTDARVRYSITRGATVRVSILDARGREVATLSSGFQPAGEHEVRWNGLQSSGGVAPSGLYIAHVEAAGASGSRHLILVQ